MNKKNESDIDLLIVKFIIISANLFYHMSAEYSKLISELGFSISIINLL
jgi:hypothetical protein